MGKINQAVNILKDLGLPKGQINDRGALTLLALLDLGEDTPWSEARKVALRIHDILQFSEKSYDRKYAENSRETFRRQTIHQFIQAGMVVLNQDNSDRATNSPGSNYTITDEALETLKKYETEEWPEALQHFLDKKGRLSETYDPRLRRSKIKIVLQDGDEVFLSPGAHNELQRDIVTEFRQNFAPSSKILYVGDTANKMLFLDHAELERIGVPITKHDKLPDVVLYVCEKDLLLLVEAVTAHGPVSPKRKMELEEILSETKVKRVYISAFPSFTEYKKYASDIAWETEVWIASDPRHMIHKNGEKFFTVYG